MRDRLNKTVEGPEFPRAIDNALQFVVARPYEIAAIRKNLSSEDEIKNKVNARLTVVRERLIELGQREAAQELKKRVDSSLAQLHSSISSS
jgi:hypothetical protein